MITIRSNIDKFLDNYRKKTSAVKTSLTNIAEKLAQKMSTDMAFEISQLRYVWVEEGNLSTVSNIDFDINVVGTNSVRVSIGNNLTPFEMSDGTLVNPVYFIEFGFGIVGENNPKENHAKYDWEYNINGHEGAWYYRGLNGELLESSGREGINFMYRVIQNYKYNWKNYLNELIGEFERG